MPAPGKVVITGERGLGRGGGDASGLGTSDGLGGIRDARCLCGFRVLRGPVLWCNWFVFRTKASRGMGTCMSALTPSTTWSKSCVSLARDSCCLEFWRLEGGRWYRRFGLGGRSMTVALRTMCTMLLTVPEEAEKGADVDAEDAKV